MWRTEGSEKRLLADYLLGNLSEQQMAEVEDRAFAEKDYMTALQSAEADLIDAWVNGELVDADRRKFEHRFLASPQRRRKVEFARTLAQLSNEHVASATPHQRPVWSWRFSMQLAGAFALAVSIASTTFLFMENRSMQSRSNEWETQAKNLSRQLTEAQARRAADTTPAAVLTLLPGVSRSQAEPRELVLQLSAPLARIEIQLEEMDDYPRYRAELRTKRGEEILTLSNLRSRRSAGGFTVTMDVPASILPAGDYELKLSGEAQGSSLHEVGYYDFRVKRN